MTLNKKLLAASIASAVSLTAAAATFNLDKSKAADINTVYFASEVTSIPARTGDSATAAVGFGVSKDATRYIRFDITGATFGSALTATDLSATSGSTAINSTNLGASIAQGGAKGNSHVIFQVTPNTQALATTDTFTLGGIDLSGMKPGTPVTIQYRIFEPAADAVNGTNALSDTTAKTVVSSATGLSSSAAKASSVYKIDVATGNTKFTTGSAAATKQSLGTLKIGAAKTGTQLDAGGSSDIAWATAAKAGSVVTVKGNFAAAKSVWLQQTTCGTAVTTGQYAGKIATDKNSVTFTSTTGGAFGGADYLVCLEVDGKTPIAKGGYTASFTAAANTSYSLASQAFTDTALSTLEKNGSESALSLMLSPSGAFANWVRLLNPTTLSGDVTIKLINDAGKSVSVPLGNVKDAFGNTLSNSLAKGTATALISVDGIYKAAQAIDSTFEVGSPADKLRMEVEAEFATVDGTTHVYGSKGIVINSVTVTNSSGRNFDTIN